MTTPNAAKAAKPEMTTKRAPKKFYIRKRNNPQLGIYYVAMGPLSRTAAKGWEKSIYRSEEHTSELQSRRDLVCRLLLEKKNVAVTEGVSCESCHVPADTWILSPPRPDLPHAHRVA